jgi:hypothetical protein
MKKFSRRYVAYLEINVWWARVGSPGKMATWHWHSTEV